MNIFLAAAALLASNCFDGHNRPVSIASAHGTVQVLHMNTVNKWCSGFVGNGTSNGFSGGRCSK